MFEMQPGVQASASLHLMPSCRLRSMGVERPAQQTCTAWPPSLYVLVVVCERVCTGWDLEQTGQDSTCSIDCGHLRWVGRWHRTVTGWLTRPVEPAHHLDRLHILSLLGVHPGGRSLPLLIALCGCSLLHVLAE